MNKNSLHLRSPRDDYGFSGGLDINSPRDPVQVFRTRLAFPTSPGQVWVPFRARAATEAATQPVGGLMLHCFGHKRGWEDSVGKSQLFLKLIF